MLSANPDGLPPKDMAAPASHAKTGSHAEADSKAEADSHAAAGSAAASLPPDVLGSIFHLLLKDPTDYGYRHVLVWWHLGCAT